MAVLLASVVGVTGSGADARSDVTESGADVRSGVTGSGADARSATTNARPRLVYVEKERMKLPRLLQGATMGSRAAIAVSWPNLVREVSFLVDLPTRSTAVHAIDRTPPYDVPRRAAAGSSPYSIGTHTIVAKVVLRTRRTIVLQASYTIARTREIAGDLDAEALQRSIDSAASGPVLVRPRAGLTSFAVEGDVVVSRPSVAIEHARLTGTLEFRPTATGSSLRSSTALGFFIFGADDITLEANTFDGRGVRKDTIIWDEPAGNTPDGWVIRGNTFRNYYTSNPEDHTQAIYVGYSTSGLIEGNTFTNNGTTSHIFFTWFGGKADPATSYPRDICVRGNVFNATAGAFSDINYRDEIPASANIRVQRDASGAGPFYGRC
jgi:hypothetical protein